MVLAPVQTTFRLPLAPQVQAQRVELLAPAGSFEALVAAVENGADAIYLAGQHFGARKFAANFTDEELRRGVDFAHVRGVKVFLTVNTLVFNDEFEALIPFLTSAREAGVDAVIVQDLGVMRVLREIFADFPLHISTQATIHNSKGVEFLENLGAERAILAREMTLKDIAQMKADTGAELETFVHGALCYCYSGQCLMSSVIGERSGNRGACAYTCRLPFDMAKDDEVMPEVEQKHVLSSKDLNQIESIPKLIESGVTSFKIEGRMKRPEYVAVVVRAYRLAIDRYYAGDFHIKPHEHEAIMAVFNREFTPGYLEGKEKWGFTSWDTDGNRGTPLGEVVAAGRGWQQVRLNDTLQVKDGIVIHHMPKWAQDQGRAREDAPPEEYGFTVSRIEMNNRYVMEAGRGALVKLYGRAHADAGDPVYKTADHATLDWARATFEGPPQRRVGAHTRVEIAVGQPIRVTMTDPERGISATHTSGFVVQPAKKAPLSRERVREQFAKMTDAVFEHDKLTIKIDGECFAPLGELNEARRAGCAALAEAIAATSQRAPLPDVATKARDFLTFPAVERPVDKTLSLAVNCWGLDNLRAALDAGAGIVYFSGLEVGGLRPKWDEDAVREAADLAAAAEAQLWLASGMIQKDWEIEALRTATKSLAGHAAFKGILAGNHGACQVAIEEQVPFVVDWPMNVYNSVTVDYLREHGAARVTLSPELTLEHMDGVARHTEGHIEAIVHGRLTLMTSEYCSIGHATQCQMPGGSWAPCHDARYSLQDRVGAEFPLETDGACRMYILNSVELNMIDRLDELAAAGLDVIRIETIGTKPDAVRTQVEAYVAALESWNDDPEDWRPDSSAWKRLEAACPSGFTTGHFYRGPA